MPHEHIVTDIICELYPKPDAKVKKPGKFYTQNALVFANPLALPMGELSAKLTERLRTSPAFASLGHLPQRGRQGAGRNASQLRTSKAPFGDQRELAAERSDAD